jgi:hypothetical protein
LAALDSDFTQIGHERPQLFALPFFFGDRDIAHERFALPFALCRRQHLSARSDTPHTGQKRAIVFVHASQAPGLLSYGQAAHSLFVRCDCARCPGRLHRLVADRDEPLAAFRCFVIDGETPMTPALWDDGATGHRRAEYAPSVMTQFSDY